MKKCMIMMAGFVLLVSVGMVCAMDSDDDEKEDGEYVRQVVQLTPEKQRELNNVLLETAQKHTFDGIASDKEIFLEKEIVDDVKRALEQGAQVNAQDGEQMTALMWAICCRNKSLVNVLLSARADVNIKDNHGSTALYHATIIGQEEALALSLIKRKAAIDVIVGNRSILKMAAESHLGEMAHILLCAGADLDLKDKFGKDMYKVSDFNDFIQKIFVEVAGKKMELSEELVGLRDVMCSRILEEQIKTRDIVEIVVDYAVPYCNDSYRLLNNFFIKPEWVRIKEELKKEGQKEDQIEKELQRKSLRENSKKRCLVS